MTGPRSITVTVSLGDARAAAELLAHLLGQVEEPEGLDTLELQQLRRFASELAGPVYGNPLGHALERFMPGDKK